MGKRWFLGAICRVSVEVDLDVISIEMEVQGETADDVTMGEQVTEKSRGPRTEPWGTP